MQCVTFVHNVPQIRFWSIFNKIFGLFYKGNWILIDSWSAKHPYFIVVYAYDSGGLAARHREMQKPLREARGMSMIGSIP